MIKHFIAISSLYSKGERIAWHYASEKLDSKLIQDFMNSLYKKHGDIQMGIHRLTTNSTDWESVVSADDYFSGLDVVENYEDFINFIGVEQNLTAVDFAKYILSIIPMSPLKLQKLLYLSYEGLIKSTGEQLFKDKIFAWRHGPVIQSVYDEFKEYGSSTIPYEEDDSVKIYSSATTVTPSFMKLISAERGPESLKIIHNVLHKYAHNSAWELVNITHQEGKPWHAVYEPDSNKLISDEIILSHA